MAQTARKAQPKLKILAKPQIQITWLSGKMETITHQGAAYVTGALVLELEGGERRIIPFSSMREFRVPKLG